MRALPGWMEATNLMPTPAYPAACCFAASCCSFCARRISPHHLLASSVVSKSSLMTVRSQVVMFSFFALHLGTQDVGDMHLAGPFAKLSRYWCLCDPRAYWLQGVISAG